MSAPTHVYEIFVKASPRRVWQAITDPDYTRRYFHRTAIESTFEPGAGYRYVMPDGSGAVDGTIEEVDRRAAAGDDVAHALRRGAGRRAGEPRRVDADAGQRRRHRHPGHARATSTSRGARARGPTCGSVGWACSTR